MYLRVGIKAAVLFTFIIYLLTEREVYQKAFSCFRQTNAIKNVAIRSLVLLTLS